MAYSEQRPLAQAFGKLQAERAASWSPDQLARNQAQRSALVQSFDPIRAVQVGDVLPPTSLIDSDGATISLDDLVAGGPAVVIFFRYAECPADNLALPIYDAALRPQLAEAGVPLIAISPQLPGRLGAIRDRHSLRLTVASDPDNALARQLGITFTPLETPAPPPAGWVGEITGTDSWELPQTSVLILGAGRRVRFVSINPDWLDRIEPDDVLTALEPIRARKLEDVAP